MSRCPPRTRAFTLMEMIVVMSLLVILVPIVMRSFGLAMRMKSAAVVHSERLQAQRVLLDEMGQDIRSARRVLPAVPAWVPAPAGPPPWPGRHNVPATQPRAKSAKRTLKYYNLAGEKPVKSPQTDLSYLPPATRPRPEPRVVPTPADSSAAVEMPDGTQVVYRWVRLYDPFGLVRPNGHLMRLEREPAGAGFQQRCIATRVRQVCFRHDASGALRVQLWFAPPNRSSVRKPYAVLVARPRVTGEGRP